MYEQLFFDTRPFLNDPKALCRLLLRDRDRLGHRGKFDWYCKIMAYGLGLPEYLRWRCHEPFLAAKAIEFACKDTLLYLNGLAMIGRDRPDDYVEAHCRLFAALPSIVSRAKEIIDAGLKRRYHDYTQQDIDDAIAMIPEAIA